MDDTSFYILTHQHVEVALDHQEKSIIQTVQQAYEYHRRGESNLPSSTFLQFPHRPGNQIIGLPAYLGGQANLAGIKWIASFPENDTLGLDRASAVIIINSIETGRPMAILEGSLISKKHTAASATLAARHLHPDPDIKNVGLIGGGTINFEIVRFLRTEYPSMRQLVLYDRSQQKAEEFRQQCFCLDAALEVVIVTSSDDVFRRAPLVSIATTAPQPYIHHLPDDRITQTILHISLGDLAPEIILQAINVVDDIEHVARAQTSIHLTEQRVGHRDFVYAPLADITTKQVEIPHDTQRVTIFTPFGPGVLDLAVSRFILEQASFEDVGIVIPS